MVQVFGNKCLEVPNGVNADGVKMQIMSCSGQNRNQQFYYDKAWSPIFNSYDIYATSNFTSGRIVLSGQT